MCLRGASHVKVASERIRPVRVFSRISRLRYRLKIEIAMLGIYVRRDNFLPACIRIFFFFFVTWLVIGTRFARKGIKLRAIKVEISTN